MNGSLGQTTTHKQSGLHSSSSCLSVNPLRRLISANARCCHLPLRQRVCKHDKLIVYAMSIAQGKYVRSYRSSYGKPDTYKDMTIKKMPANWKKKKKQKEEEVEERDVPDTQARVTKRNVSKPPEDCIALLFEQQPLRLHNNITTFPCSTSKLSLSKESSLQESSALTQKVSWPDTDKPKVVLPIEEPYLSFDKAADYEKEKRPKNGIKVENAWLSYSGRTYISPRHRSRSTGSRSCPSRSSIPGLYSKYSRPDPKNAKKESASTKPLYAISPLLKADEQTNLGTLSPSKAEHSQDDVTVTFFKGSQKEEETEEELMGFDWSDSDDEDDPPMHHLPAGARSCPDVEILPPPPLLPMAKLEMELGSIEVDQKALFIADTRPFEKTSNPTEAEQQAQGEASSNWSDLDADSGTELGLLHVDASCDVLGHTRSLFQSNNGSLQCTWTSQTRANGQETKEDDIFDQSDLVAEVDMEEIRSREEIVALRDSRDEVGACVNSNFSVEVDQSVKDHIEVHELPETVKYVEPPPWKSLAFPGFPFEVQHSYSETPSAPVLGYRDDMSPFGPDTMARPWTGGMHIRPRRHLQSIIAFDPALERKKSYELTFYPKVAPGFKPKRREEILGKPLTREEIIDLVQRCHEGNRQVDLGRDGLTHNMLNLIHSHWKRCPVCKIRCRGVPTVDMDNLCFHIEEKTGGQIIYRVGGVMYVFRGHNYRYKYRPPVPLMLWKPPAPVYPRLVQEAPDGLTKDEAEQLRILGLKVRPLLKLGRHHVYLNLVKEVRDAFMKDDLVALDCEELECSDYKKLGARLRDLVPCVLLSLKKKRILLWKGRSSESSSEECAVAAAGAFSAADHFVKGTGDAESGHVSNFEEVGSKGLTNDDVVVLEAPLCASMDIEENKESLAGHLGSLQKGHLGRNEEELRATDGVDALWLVALEEGMAVQVEGIELEADLVLHKTSAFSEITPAGPEYTGRLVNQLRIRMAYDKTNRPLVVPFSSRYKRALMNRKPAKRAAHAPETGMPPQIPIKTKSLFRILSGRKIDDVEDTM